MKAREDIVVLTTSYNDHLLLSTAGAVPRAFGKKKAMAAASSSVSVVIVQDHMVAAPPGSGLSIRLHHKTADLGM